jgi:hypothetical protein
MRLNLALLGLVRGLGLSVTQRRVTTIALISLARQRRRVLAAAGPLLRLLPTFGTPKLRLWQTIAASQSRRGAMGPPSSQLLSALQATDAYRKAEQRVRTSASSPFSRGLNYQALRRRLGRQPPQRVLVFHHYDRRGYLPQSWQQFLLICQQAGWQVIVSTSALHQRHALELEQHGVFVARRLNQGLCLGAYKDLALLLQLDAVVSAGLCSLVLCNDSTLPVSTPASLIAQLDQWVQLCEADHQPILAGLTDSAQRDRYHLQSYLLYANAALLQGEAWRSFWLRFAPCGTKDQLIDQGEIGLSQALMANGVDLRPAYPLIPRLLSGGSVAAELQRYRIVQPMHVNQTLFLWQSLLEAGFPLVKKQLLFDLIESHGQPMAMTSLSRWIPAECLEILSADLHELFVSRHSGPECGPS